MSQISDSDNSSEGSDYVTRYKISPNNPDGIKKILSIRIFDELLETSGYTDLLFILEYLVNNKNQYLYWFIDHRQIHSKLLEETIRLNRVIILKWLKDANAGVTGRSYNLIVSKNRIDILSQLYYLGFYLPSNICTLAARKGRKDILQWIDANVINSKQPKINYQSLIEAATYGKRSTFKWLVSRGYANFTVFNTIAEMGERFHYLYFLHQNSVRGKLEYNKWIEDESLEFIDWVTKQKSDIDYPSDLFDSIKNNNQHKISKYCLRNCHLMYRELMKFDNVLIVEICSVITINKYLYRLLVENKKLNIVAKTIKFHIDITNLEIEI